MARPAAAAGLTTPAGDFRRLAVFFAAVYFVQGFAEPKAGIAAQPLFFLLKDGLRLGVAETATFLALVGLAWTVKPLYGLLSDLVPLAGSRRRSYLLLTTAMAALGWLVLGLLPGYGYGSTLAVLALVGLGLAFTDVVCDAVMVEEGRPRGLTGRFQSIQWGAINTAAVVAGVGGGYLSAYVAYGHVFLLVACFPALSFAASAYAVHEPPARFDRAGVRATLAALRAGLVSGPLWRSAAFIFLWNFSPSFGTPLQFYMIDVLGISKVQLGLLATFGSAASVAGAFLFGRYLRGYPLKRLLNVAVGIGVGGTLAYYGLAGWWSAVILAVTVSLATMVAFLATLDLAARAVPSRAEGTFFAGLMSVNNIATTGSVWVGGQLYDWVGLHGLIALSAATTAACWLLVPWVRAEQLEPRTSSEGEGPTP